MLRTIRGYAAAEQFIRSRPALGEETLPPEAMALTWEVVGPGLALEQAVARILARVRAEGDAALRDLTRRFDGVELDALEVAPEELAAARTQADPDLVRSLEVAAEQLRSFHERQRRQSWVDLSQGALGQIIRPLDRVGLHAPGFRAAYPSTVLHTAIPARVAGVREIILCTPRLNPVILAAAAIAGVDRVFRIGGAQAIAAMAYGTESVPQVDKVCGPGNVFVALAKRQVFGTVGIDAIQGPTEALIIADYTANPTYCALDLLAQAEHDELAAGLVITTSSVVLEAVERELARLLPTFERRSIMEASLNTRGALVLVDTIEQAISLANLYAPEHLSLVVERPWDYVGSITNAGGIFVGESSPETLGDYAAGPSHVMPTGRTARFSSPLNVNDFVKMISLVALNGATLAQVGPAAASIARAEGLTAHARSIEARLERAEG